MVQILSKEQLNGLSQKELKSRLKALAKAGYPVNMEEIKQALESALTEEEENKYLRKKIRHALRETPSKSKSSDAVPNRYAELNKLCKRSKNKETDLVSIAKPLNINRYTTMNKGELIAAIIAAEKDGSQPKSKSKSKSPSKKVEEVVQSKSKSKSKDSSSSKKDCGEYNYEELLEKSLKKLQSLLKKQGVDASSVESKEHAADLYCNLKQNDNKTCDADNKYKCGDGLICDVSTNPGVCVDKESAFKQAARLQYHGREIIGNKEAIDKLRIKLGIENKTCGSDNRYKCEDGLICDISTKPGQCVDKGVAWKQPAWLQYHGRQIVGSKEAIDKLRLKLGIKEQEISDEELAENKPLIKKAARISGKSKDVFKKMNTAQLQSFIEGHEIEEQRAKSKLIKQLAKAGQDPEELSDLTYEQVCERVKKMKPYVSDSMSREEMIEYISSALNRDSSEIEAWSDSKVERRFKKLKDAVAEAEEEAEKESEEEVIEEVLEPVKKEKKKSKPVVEEETVEEEEEEEAEEAEEETVEESLAESKKKQEEVKRQDIEKVLSEVMAGKKGSKIEEFSEVQNKVLQCLGLVAA